MTPSELKVGQRVKLNPEFLKIWWKINKYLPPSIKDQIIEIVEIKQRSRGSALIHEPYVFVRFSWDTHQYDISITLEGYHCLACHDTGSSYLGIQVYIPVDQVMTPGPKYCSCGGAKKENWASGERFFVCVNCGLEAL